MKFRRDDQQQISNTTAAPISIQTGADVAAIDRVIGDLRTPEDPVNTRLMDYNPIQAEDRNQGAQVFVTKIIREGETESQNITFKMSKKAEMDGLFNRGIFEPVLKK